MSFLPGMFGGATAASSSGPVDLLTTPTKAANFGAYSFSRKMWSGYNRNGGAFYVLNGSRASRLHDQSPLDATTLDFYQSTSGQQPLITTAGPNSRACAQFTNARGDNLYSGVAHVVNLSDFFSGTQNYAICSFIVDSFDTNQAASFNNQAVWADHGEFVGLHLKSGLTKVIAYEYDGGVNVAEISSLATATAYVVEWVQGSNMEVSLNGSTTVGAACAAISSRSDYVMLGSSLDAGFSGKIFEILFIDTVPTSGERAALISNMRTWIGA